MSPIHRSCSHSKQGDSIWCGHQGMGIRAFLEFCLTHYLPTTRYFGSFFSVYLVRFHLSASLELGGNYFIFFDQCNGESDMHHMHGEAWLWWNTCSLFPQVTTLCRFPAHPRGTGSEICGILCYYNIRNRE